MTHQAHRSESHTDAGLWVCQVAVKVGAFGDWQLFLTHLHPTCGCRYDTGGARPKV
jgi:hypothetical protein